MDNSYKSIENGIANLSGESIENGIANLSKEDAVKFLSRVAAGIAQMFGKYCETVVQDLEGDKMTMLAIYNGHVSGRSVGSTESIYENDTEDFMKFLSESKINLENDSLNHIVSLPGSRFVKSSSFFLNGEDYRLILGINYDITLMRQIENMSQDMISADTELLESLKNNYDSSAETLLQSALELISKPVAQMTKDDRVFLVKTLMDTNFFELRKSVPLLAEELGVSEYTIYKYKKEIAEQ